MLDIICTFLGQTFILVIVICGSGWVRVGVNISTLRLLLSESNLAYCELFLAKIWTEHWSNPIPKTPRGDFGGELMIYGHGLNPRQLLVVLE